MTSDAEVALCECPLLPLVEWFHMKALIISLRPEQWIKNLFVFAPLLFSRYLFDFGRSVSCVTAFLIFCLISGSVYLINDVADIDHDRLHPEKSRRPLASGNLKVRTAIVASLLLFMGSVLSAFFLNMWFSVVIVSYFALNLLYSFYLKHVVILDVMAIASGFLLRILGGAVVISVRPTAWILVCSSLLALFLALSKRRHEVVLLEKRGNAHRRVLQHYTPLYLDQAISIVMTATLMSYILYTISEETVERFGSTKLLLTTPFVCYGMLRYLYLIHKSAIGGNPGSALLRDFPLLISVILWASFVLVLIYFV